MDQDFTLNMLAGGCTDCSASWKNRVPKYDQCYKFYLPIHGFAHVSDSAKRYALEPGFLYFISGYELKSQECPVGMSVHWLHFTPASFYLHRQLLRVPCVHKWSVEKVAWAAGVMEKISVMFENATSLNPSENTLNPKASFSLMCGAEAMMLYLVSDLLETFAPTSEDDLTPELERLRKAIVHMDMHFIDNPPLADLAGLVNMAPNSFHRLFRETMGVTPYNYMTTKRLDQGLRLLAGSNKTISGVAMACGYSDPLYFSRVFSRHFGMSPSQSRGRVPQMP
jgi:AraC-like DNA-binding protein